MKIPVAIGAVLIAAVMVCCIGGSMGAASIGAGFSNRFAASTALTLLEANACVPRADSPRGSGGEAHIGETYDDLGKEQRRNAIIVIGVAKGLKIPEQDRQTAALIALMTIIVENHMLNKASVNVPGSEKYPNDGIDDSATADNTSIGLFQQLNDWGPPAVRMNPVLSAKMFFTGGPENGQPGLLDLPKWQEMPLGDAAQAVQGSDFPDRYEEQEPLAREILAKLGPSAPAISTADPSAAAPEVECESTGAGTPLCTSTGDDDGCADLAMIFKRAESWLTAWSNGKQVPYCMCTDPGTLFRGYRRDCSGYVSMALGLPGPGLDTSGLAARSKRIGKNDLQPGDLMINPGLGEVGHVVLFERWTDETKTHYWGYHQSSMNNPNGGSGTSHIIFPYPYFPWKMMWPYRLNRN